MLLTITLREQVQTWDHPRGKWGFGHPGDDLSHRISAKVEIMVHRKGLSKLRG